MKYLVLIFIASLSTVTGYSQSVGLQTNDKDPKAIIISKVVKTLNKDELTLGFDLENKSDKNVLIATNPTQLNDKQGYYLFLNKTDSSILEVSSSVYPKYPWESYSYSNDIRVELKQLKPGEKYSDQVVITFPTRETIPPYYDPFPKNKKILPAEIKQIKLIIGYFMEDGNTAKFTNIQPSGWYVRGETKLPTRNNTDTTFFEIQKLATINIPFAANK